MPICLSSSFEEEEERDSMYLHTFSLPPMLLSNAYCGHIVLGSILYDPLAIVATQIPRLPTRNASGYEFCPRPARAYEYLRMCTYQLVHDRALSVC